MTERFLERGFECDECGTKFDFEFDANQKWADITCPNCGNSGLVTVRPPLTIVIDDRNRRTAWKPSRLCTREELIERIQDVLSALYRDVSGSLYTPEESGLQAFVTVNDEQLSEDL